MKTVTGTRTLEAPRDRIHEAIVDLESFTRAAGFDEVEVKGWTMYVGNHVGIANIQLVLAVIDDPDSTLSYEQRKGIFEEMRTADTGSPCADGTIGTARTELALDVAIAGDVLDATVIKRQRRNGLTAQLDYLGAVTFVG